MTDKFNFYETLYLVRPDIESAELSVFQGKLDEALKQHGGETIKKEKWSERDLAYEIRRYRRGTYHVLTYKAMSGVAAAVEKQFGLHKNEVMRFITVSVDEDRARGKEPEKPAEKIGRKPKFTPKFTEGEKTDFASGRRSEKPSETAKEIPAPNPWKSAQSPNRNEQ